MDDRWEVASAVVVNVLYLAAMAGVVLALFPAARSHLSGFTARQVHAWRYGRWLASRAPLPPWTAALTARELAAEREWPR